MGGIGSKGSGANAYTKHNVVRTVFVPKGHESGLHRVPGSAEHFVRVVARGLQRKQRKDKGKKRGAKDDLQHDIEGTFTFEELQCDIERTCADIAEYELREAHIAQENTPNAKIRRKKRNYQRVLRSREVHGRSDVANLKAKRDALLPADRVCILCETHKPNSNQWCVFQFADGKHATCRSCYDTLRKRYFGGDMLKCLAFITACNYALISQVYRLNRNLEVEK